MSIDQAIVTANVRTALEEDIGTGDITATLIPADMRSSAILITREPAILAGTLWFDETFRQLDPTIEIKWNTIDRDAIKADQTLCRLSGTTRSILSAERTAINFLQTLSGTATTVSGFVDLIKHTDAKILDTRKTIPGLRLAQKYAVTCGGGLNHRIGLYDALFIKENHIAAAGGITAAVGQVRGSGLPVEVEVESIAELEEALAVKADQILLDNFTVSELAQAVELNRGKSKLEASGNIDRQNIRAVAETGIDYISIGALTKHIRAIDFSLSVIASSNGKATDRG